VKHSRKKKVFEQLCAILNCEIAEIYYLDLVRKDQLMQLRDLIQRAVMAAATGATASRRGDEGRCESNAAEKW